MRALLRAEQRRPPRIALGAEQVEAVHRLPVAEEVADCTTPRVAPLPLLADPSPIKVYGPPV